jgi:hypothetical protein
MRGPEKLQRQENLNNGKSRLGREETRKERVRNIHRGKYMPLTRLGTMLGAVLGRLGFGVDFIFRSLRGKALGAVSGTLHLGRSTWDAF